MHHTSDGLGGIIGMIVTIVFAFIARFTLSDWSAVSTMIAAAATAAYYITKTVHLIKNNRKKNKS